MCSSGMTDVLLRPTGPGQEEHGVLLHRSQEGGTGPGVCEGVGQQQCVCVHVNICVSIM